MSLEAESGLPPDDDETVARSKERILTFEPRHHQVCWDDANRPVIGYGFDLEREDASHLLESIGANYDELRSGRGLLSDVQMDALLDADVNRALSIAREHAPGFDRLPIAERVRHVDLAYTLGASRYDRFLGLAATVNDGGWESTTKSARSETAVAGYLAADEDS